MLLVDCWSFFYLTLFLVRKIYKIEIIWVQIYGILWKDNWLPCNELVKLYLNLVVFFPFVNLSSSVTRAKKPNKISTHLKNSIYFVNFIPSLKTFQNKIIFSKLCFLKYGTLRCFTEKYLHNSMYPHLKIKIKIF